MTTHTVSSGNWTPLATRRARNQKIADEAFVGRQQELSTLKRVIGTPAECGLANLYGISGMGKSTLLAKLIEAARAQGSISCLIDLAFCRSQISLLSKLSEGLSAPFLDETTCACLHIRSRYVQLHRNLVESRALSASLVAQISRLSEFDSVPYQASVGPHLELAPESLAVAESVLGLDYPFFRDPAPEFAHALVLDINGLANTRPANTSMLIVLDRSEAVPHTLLAWFRDEVFQELVEIAALVIAGQRRLTNGWDTLLQPELSIELKQMSDVEVAALAGKFAIRDAAALEWIYRASHGVPLLVEEFCRSYLGNPHIIDTDPHSARPPEMVVNRYLSSIAPNYREDVQRAALLRSISSESVTQILKSDHAAQIIAVIETLPYVAEGPNGFFIHDYVRDYLNRHFHKHNPSAFADICARAADYYAQRSAAGIAVFESLSEELYYRVRASPDTGLESLNEGFSRFASLNQPQECEMLVEIAVQAGLPAAAWIAHFRAVILYLRSRYLESLKALEAVLNDVALGMDDELRQQVLFYCAVDSWYLCLFTDAFNYANRSLEALIPPKSINRRASERTMHHRNRALGIVALTQDRTGRFVDGITSALKMAEAARASNDLSSLGYALNSAGYFSWHEGDWQAADGYLAESIKTWGILRSDFGSCYPVGHRAAMRTMVGDPTYGVGAIARCVDLCKAKNNVEMQCKAGYAYAEALWSIGSYEESAAHAAQAVQLAHEIGQRYFEADALRVQAAACLMLGDRAATETALRDSLALSVAISAPFIERRVSAIAYAADLHTALKLPNIDLAPWIRASVAQSFSRAAFDLGRLAARTATINRLGGAEGPALLLAGALVLNFNAFLILTREMKQAGLAVPTLGDVAGIAARGLTPGRPAGARTARARECIARSLQRGLKGSFNAWEWDSAIELYGKHPHRRSRGGLMRRLP